MQHLVKVSKNIKDAYTDELRIAKFSSVMPSVKFLGTLIVIQYESAHLMAPQSSSFEPNFKNELNISLLSVFCSHYNSPTCKTTCIFGVVKFIIRISFLGFNLSIN